MRFLDVLPLTEDVLTAALGCESLSFEDALVAAAGDLAGIDAILTSDAGFVRTHDNACTPGDPVSVLERNLGEKHTCRVVRVSEAGAFRVEISDPQAAGARRCHWRTIRRRGKRSGSRASWIPAYGRVRRFLMSATAATAST